ncbi:MAG: hypothetical protein V3U80_06815 [Flavobacteriaceae bacterium]
MKKIIFLIFFLTILISCNDGDFDTPSFTFGTDINDCGELILFNIDDNEALILNLSQNNSNNEFYTTAQVNEVYSLENAISYRVFNNSVNSSYFCQNIPPATPSIVEQWNGSGNLLVNNSTIYDDNDGVSSIIENGGIDPYTDEDGDLVFHYLDDDDTNASIGNVDNLPQIDTDGDQIANFYDLDDDNDGIKTINELERDINDILLTDTEGNYIPMQTDNDSIPDYLDNDDDDDNTLTINEFRTDSNSNGINDYLDATFTDTQTAFNLFTNKYTLNFATTFIIEDMNLSNNNGNVINYDRYEFGTKTGNFLLESE